MPTSTSQQRNTRPTRLTLSIDRWRITVSGMLLGGGAQPGAGELAEIPAQAAANRDFALAG